MDGYESSSSSSHSSDNGDCISSGHTEVKTQLRSHTDRSSEEDVHMADPAVESLLDLAVKVTAKHLSCEEIQQQQPVQDDTVLKKVKCSHCCR